MFVAPVHVLFAVPAGPHWGVPFQFPTQAFCPRESVADLLVLSVPNEAIVSRAENWGCLSCIKQQETLLITIENVSPSDASVCSSPEKLCIILLS